jgi:hypothetical protein
MSKLYLHAGLHKTGTSAIQAFAHKNRADLLKQGLFYPDYKPMLRRRYEAHHDLAHTLAGKGKRLSLAQVNQLGRNWADEAAKCSATVLLSSEAICRHIDNTVNGTWKDKRRAYLSSLAQTLSCFDITVVAVIRRQDNYIKSLFQEHVMKNTAGGRVPFAEFRIRLQENKVLRRFYPNILLFEEFFLNTKVLLYEDLAADGRLCVNFFAQLGVDVQDMQDVGVVRRSLSPGETVLKNFLNQGINSKMKNKEVLTWIKSHEGQKFLDKHVGNDDFDLWESHQAREEFLAEYQDDNEQIRQRYFPERESLFPELEENTKPKIPFLPEKSKAELILYALSKKRSSIWSRMLVSWIKRKIQTTGFGS